MVSGNKAAALLLSGLLVLPQALLASPLEVSTELLPSIPAGGNARILASVKPGSTVSSARVYFNAEGQKPEYYVEMVRGAEGGFWAMLPVPKSETKSVDYRVVLADGDGKLTQSARMTSPVKGKQKTEPTEAEKRYARNLVIGVTDPDVQLLPEGFECEGVVSSINIRGELKPNEVCRTVVIPAALWVAAGAAVATATVVIVPDDPEPPPQPPPPVSPASAPPSAPSAAPPAPGR